MKQLVLRLGYGGKVSGEHNTTTSRRADWLIIFQHAGDKLNQQHIPSVDQNVLARETEQLARECAWLVNYCLFL